MGAGVPFTSPLGMIGGTGWLGASIARRLLSSGCVVPERLWLSNRSGRRDGFEDWPAVTITPDNNALVAACKTAGRRCVEMAERFGDEAPRIVDDGAAADG